MSGASGRACAIPAPRPALATAPARTLSATRWRVARGQGRPGRASGERGERAASEAHGPELSLISKERQSRAARRQEKGGRTGVRRGAWCALPGARCLVRAAWCALRGAWCGVAPAAPAPACIRCPLAIRAAGAGAGRWCGPGGGLNLECAAWRDLILVAMLTLGLATLVTAHVSLVWRLFRLRPRWRALAALVVPPLAGDLGPPRRVEGDRRDLAGRGGRVPRRAHRGARRREDLRSRRYGWQVFRPARDGAERVAFSATPPLSCTAGHPFRVVRNAEPRKVNARRGSWPVPRTTGAQVDETIAQRAFRRNHARTFFRACPRRQPPHRRQRHPPAHLQHAGRFGHLASGRARLPPQSARRGPRGRTAPAQARPVPRGIRRQAREAFAGASALLDEAADALRSRL